MVAAGKGGKARAEGLAVGHQLPTEARQLLVPVGQCGAQLRLLAQGFEQHIALAQRALVLLEQKEVGRVGLGEFHVQEPPALGGAVLYDGQVLGREQHAVEQPHQLADADKRQAVGLDFSTLLAAEAHGQLVIRAGALAAQADERKGRVIGDQILFAGGAVRPAEAAEEYRLEQIGLALRVLAHDQVDARLGGKLAGFVIAEIGQRQLFDEHGCCASIKG